MKMVEKCREGLLYREMHTRESFNSGTFRRRTVIREKFPRRCVSRYALDSPDVSNDNSFLLS